MNWELFNIVLLSGVPLFALFLVLGIKPMWVFYATILILPIDNFMPSVMVPFVGAMATVTNILSVLLAIAFIPRLAIYRNTKIRWSASLTAFSLFTLWSFVSIAWSIDSNQSIKRSIGYSVFLALYFVLCNMINSEKVLRRSAIIYGLSGTFIIVTALLSLGTGFEGRASGLLGNPNSLATAIIACSLGVMLYTSFYEQRTRYKWKLPLAYFSLGILAIILSASRGGVLGILIILLGLILWNRTAKARVIVLALVSVILIIIIIIPSIYAPLAERTFQSERDSLGGRYELWRISWEAIQEQPLVGHGSGVASSLVGRRFYEGYNIYEDLAKSVHNPILEVWLDTGLVGLVLYMFAIFQPVIMLVKDMKFFKRDKDSPLREKIMIILVCFAGYFAVWIKNGGSVHDKNMFIYLAVIFTVTSLNNRPIALKNSR